ncbi:putative tyrosinase-like protein tyr-3 [Nymphon striatum]|nr:putative tyrosinase-like protein tyr-3 [Nymphon striatum]
MKPTTIKGCEDKHKKCAVWAKKGLCSRKRVAKTCRKSCGTCGTTTAGPTTTTTTESTMKPTTIKGCEDKHKKCAVWAKKGLCSRKRVAKTCRKSCGTCGTTTAGPTTTTTTESTMKPTTIKGCEDKHKKCAVWAKKGLCSRKRVAKTCRKSCGTCGTTTAGPTTTTTTESTMKPTTIKGCEDKHKKCAVWAKKGLCSRKRVAKTCRKSCGTCGTTTAGPTTTTTTESTMKPTTIKGCEDKHKKCAVWAKKGLCSRKRVAKTCRKSCGTCGTTTAGPTTTTTTESTMKPTTIKGCEDKHKKCAVWAKKGLCSRKRVAKTCRKSCGTCGTTTAGPTTTTTTESTMKPTTIKGCEDKHKKCAVWAKKGLCSRKRVAKTCRKSCGTCGTTTAGPTTTTPTTSEPTMNPTTIRPTTMPPTTIPPTIKPTTIRPTTLKPTTISPITMEFTTKKHSTMRPTTNPHSTMKPTTTTGCDDNHKKCTVWAKKGLCSRKRVAKTCRKSCRTCGTTTAGPTTTTTTESTMKPTTIKGCEDKHKKCAVWAKKGLCSRKRVAKTCQKSCGTCGTTTAGPTTTTPTTSEPTMNPTTIRPTTMPPTTIPPTIKPSTIRPTTLKPTTISPITMEFTTKKHSTMRPTTKPHSTMKPTTTTGCDDNHKKCTVWAKKGLCSRKRVAKTCRKSCGTCGTTTAGPTTTTTTESTMKPTTIKGCEDKHKKCAVWAKKGLCSRKRVAKTCRKSCGTCGTTTAGPTTTTTTESTMKPTTIKGCEDKHKKCAVWAKKGLCSRKRVAKTCRKSCGTCGTTTAGPTTTTTTESTMKPTTIKGCEDKHKKCEVWAKKGLCSRKRVAKTCRKSCGTCGTTTAGPTTTTTTESTMKPTTIKGCEDKHKKCAVWAKKGLCSRKRVAKTCRKSCGTCGTTTAGPTTTTTTESTMKPITIKGCEDKHKKCAVWAKKGLCSRKRVAKTCRKSCGTCGTTTAGPTTTTTTESTMKPTTIKGCEDKHKKCAVWAKKGLCSRKRVAKTCRKSCGTCGTTTAGPTTTTTTESTMKPTTIKGCEDKHKKCAVWAKKGLCSRKRVAKTCRKSCGTCGTTTAGPTTTTTTESTMKPTTIKGCEDKHKKCAVWAKKGLCSRKRVAKTCRKSCGTCGTTTAGPTTTTTTESTMKPTTIKGCEDKHKKCAVWAKKGLCKKLFVSKNCRKSCGHCGSTTGRPSTHTTMKGCMDKNKKCRVWKKKGLCKKSFVSKNCRKSCGHCGSTSGRPSTHTTMKDCMDKNKKCREWKVKGLCKKAFVSKNCRKSCGKCGTTTRRPSTKMTSTHTTMKGCMDKHKKCREWKMKGLCKKTFVFKNCRKSCGKCGTTTRRPSTKMTSTHTTMKGCMDKHKTCREWKKKGLCKKAFVSKNCKKSCGKCGTTTGRPSTKMTSTTTTMKICMDKHKKCREWKKKGLCKKPIVSKNCRKSCGHCGSTTGRPSTHTTMKGCMDKNKKCRVWKRKGLCKKSFVSKNCRKSCGHCGSTSGRPSTHTTMKGCMDKNKKCREWKKKGLCKKTFVSMNCRKSCGKCGTTTRRPSTKMTSTHTTMKGCMDKHKKCREWKMKGLCKKTFVSKNCRKSCGKCGTTTRQPSTKMTSTHTTMKGCMDKHKKCREWKMKGLCKKTFVSKNCRKSCGKCGTTTRRPSTKMTSTHTTMKGCMDKHKKCKEWKKKGLCKKTFVSKNCRKSCGKCGTTTRLPSTKMTSTHTTMKGCMDKHKKCREWKMKGLCKKTFVSKNCRKSCGKCGTTTRRPSTKMTSTHTTMKGCMDKHKKCREWKKKGLCKKTFVSKNCRKSCGKCGTTTRRPSTKMTSTHTTMKGCMDKHKKCKEWKKKGLCKKTFVSKNCRKSCGTCGTTTRLPSTKMTSTHTTMKGCMDKHKKCREWKMKGLCKKTFVSKNCRKSCGKCGTTTRRPSTKMTSTHTTMKGCMDKHKKCREWKKKGLCKKTFVSKNCRKSCGKCGTTTRRPSTKMTSTHTTMKGCMDKHKKCREWKMKGFCKKTFVSKNCRKSCGKCGTTTRRPSTMMTSTHTTMKGCMDKHKKCREWKMKGLCKKTFVSKNCRKSCGKCGTTTRRPSTKMTSRHTTMKGCVDTNKKCREWKKKGLCKKSFVSKNCRKSCGNCGTTTRRSSTKISSRHTTMKDCVDKNKKCREWKKKGLCKKSFVSKNCRKSCGKCGTTTRRPSTKMSSRHTTMKGCMDKHMKCREWKKKGFCKETFVSKNCRKSCGKCGTTRKPSTRKSSTRRSSTRRSSTRRSSTKSTGTIGVGCTDKHKKCREWKKKGLCKKTFVSKNCRKSCGKCGTTRKTSTRRPSTRRSSTKSTGTFGVGCPDKHKKCREWKKKGLCKKTFVSKNCRKSCGKCGTTGKPSTRRSSTKGTSTKKVTTNKGCTDNNSKCKRWKRRCNKKRVRDQCRKTCGVCGSKSTRRSTKTTRPSSTKRTRKTTVKKPRTTVKQNGNCRDTRRNCAKLAAKGKCKTHYFMKVRCKKSCGTCDSSLPKGDCTDYNRVACLNIQLKGKCDQIEFLSKCKKSCSKDCKQSACQDTRRVCKKWSRRGLCQNKMRVVAACRKSCNVCGKIKTILLIV